MKNGNKTILTFTTKEGKFSSLVNVSTKSRFNLEFSIEYKGQAFKLTSWKKIRGKNYLSSHLGKILIDDTIGNAEAIEKMREDARQYAAKMQEERKEAAMWSDYHDL